MDGVLLEDIEWMHELMKMKNPPNNAACEPVIPEAFDILDQVFEQGISSDSADARFQYEVSETFDGKGLLRRV